MFIAVYAANRQPRASPTEEDPIGRMESIGQRIATKFQSLTVSQRAYKGLNGRLSGYEQQIDWAGVGDFETFVQRYQYGPDGLRNALIAPFVPSYPTPTPRTYAKGLRSRSAI